MAALKRNVFHNFTQEHEEPVSLKLHPAGRELRSYWSVNSFIKIVYEKKIVLLWTEDSD